MTELNSRCPRAVYSCDRDEAGRGRAGFAPRHLSLQRSLFILSVVLGGYFYLFLVSLRFSNLNDKPPEQTSNLLVIE